MRYESYWKDMKDCIDSLNHQNVLNAHTLIKGCADKGGALLIGGNGGSASTSEHATCDLSKGLSQIHNSTFRALSLTSNMSQMTAWANDGCYEDAMSEILRGLAKKDDLVLLVSGSGNSKNIIKAADVAKSLGLKLIGLTGFDGGALSRIVDLEIRVESNDMQIVENLHLSIVHALLKI